MLVLNYADGVRHHLCGYNGDIEAGSMAINCEVLAEFCGTRVISVTLSLPGDMIGRNSGPSDLPTTDLVGRAVA
jgi:hypothetical protein